MNYNDPFVPHKFECYWYVNLDNRCLSKVWMGDTDDIDIASRTLLFKIKAAALDYCDYLKILRRYRRPFEIGEENWTLGYNHKEDTIYFKNLGDFDYGAEFFGSLKNLKDFQEEVGDLRIKRYYFPLSTQD